MSHNNTVLYTGKTTTTGGREGHSHSSDSRLDITLSAPNSRGTGTNPEQLFASAWSACFIGAMSRASQELGDGYFLQGRLNANLPGLDLTLAQSIVDLAHQLCPYSKATRGNIHAVVTAV
jgi:osmotically inducible protein OsmC